MSNPMPPPPPPSGPMPAPPGAFPSPSAAHGPRPDVKVGATIAIVGAVLMIIGSFLTWFSIDLGFGDSESFNGFSTGAGDTKDGPVFVFLAVVVGGLAVALVAAKRVLAVAIVAVVFAAFSVMAALADIGDVSDAKDALGSFGDAVKWGPGLWVILIGALMGLGGSIAALAKRRR